MKKCDQCGATIMFDARTFADHTFCSLKCIVIAKKAGLVETGDEQTDPSSSKRFVPILATIHALIPLLCATGLISRRGSAMAPIALALFWSWPLWLWPLIRYRHRQSTLSALALVTSLIAMALAAIPMFVMTAWLLLPNLKL